MSPAVARTRIKRAASCFRTHYRSAHSTAVIIIIIIDHHHFSRNVYHRDFLHMFHCHVGLFSLISNTTQGNHPLQTILAAKSRWSDLHTDDPVILKQTQRSGKDNGGVQVGDIFDKRNVSTRNKAQDLAGCLLGGEQLPRPAIHGHVTDLMYHSFSYSTRLTGWLTD